MATGGDTRAVLGGIRVAFDAGSVAGLNDAQLLARFAARGDESGRLAFEAILSRHGPMVLGVCRSLLRDRHEAEDAFQATFLVLVRKAGSVWVRDSLAGWLGGVAYKVAARSRKVGSRRAACEDVDRLAAPEGDLDASDLRRAVQEEVGRLPEKYRTPIVLCHLEGSTHEEAARALRIPVGTVRSRLARGRDLLRARLMRRGLAPAGGVLVAALAVDAAVPSTLLESTVRAATSVAASGTVAAGLVSASAAALTRGVLQTMFLSKLKLGGVAILASCLLFAGGRSLTRAQGVAPVERPNPPTAVTEEPSRPVLRAAQNRIERPSAVDELPPSTPSPRSLAVRLKQAESRAARLRSQYEAAVVPAAEFEDARDNVDLLKSQIAERAEALRDEIELLTIELRVGEAQLTGLDARLRVAKDQYDYSKRMQERAMISARETAVAEADLASLQSERGVRVAEISLIGTRIKQARRKLDALEKIDTSSPNPAAKPGPPAPPPGSPATNPPAPGATTPQP